MKHSQKIVHVTKGKERRLGHTAIRSSMIELPCLPIGDDSKEVGSQPGSGVKLGAVQPHQALCQPFLKVIFLGLDGAEKTRVNVGSVWCDKIVRLARQLQTFQGSRFPYLQAGIVERDLRAESINNQLFCPLRRSKIEALESLQVEPKGIAGGSRSQLQLPLMQVLMPDPLHCRFCIKLREAFSGGHNAIISLGL